MAGPDGIDRSDAETGDQLVEGETEGELHTEDFEELSLGDEDERLPWLESADYEDDDGVDSGRIVGFALLGLLALAVLIGAIWWFSNRSVDPELVADGSTIAAPAGPAKQRPEDPGGKTFAGTGNVAPGVGEGQTREGRLANDDTLKPGADTAPGADNSANVDALANSDSSVVGVQVGAYSTRESAQKGWGALARQTDAIKGFKHRIVEGKADIGTVYRLQAVANDAASAKKLCAALRDDGLACQVK